MKEKTNRFTEQEVAVVGLLARGYTHGEIASEIFCSESSVKQHCRLIEAKLGVASARKIPVAYMEATGNDPFPRPPASVPVPTGAKEWAHTWGSA